MGFKVPYHVVGEVYDTSTGGKCTVVEYTDHSNVVVKFHDPECYVKCRMHHLKVGNVKNPLKPRVFGKGYLGIGKYQAEDKKYYKPWNRMLERAYSVSWVKAHPHYGGVSVCEEWYNFQNFAAWCDTQDFFNEQDNKCRRYELDKDIIVKGNKVYSPETCSFIPKDLNTLLIKSYKTRGVFPVGVSLYKKSGKFRASLCLYGKTKHIGYYNTPKEAFQAYKETKESYVREVAEDWKDLIDDRVYEALKDYSVDIND